MRKKKLTMSEGNCGLNGWATINCVGGLSTRIKLDAIRKIEIRNDDINIRIRGNDYPIKVRRYNQNTIEVRLRYTQRFFEDLHMGDDNCYEKGAKERHIREDQERERHYLESLDKNLIGKDWEETCAKAISRDMSWLRDKDFDRLKQQLESLSDKFALSIDDEQRRM